MNKYHVAIASIVSIALITTLALASGMNGNVVISAIAVLGGLGGYIARQLNHPRTP